MIIIIFHFILFLSIIFLHGLIFSNKVLKLNDNRNFYEISLIGLVITIFISQIVNFLLPLSDNLLYLNIFLLIIFLIFNNKILFSIPKLNIYVFFIAFLPQFVREEANWSVFHQFVLLGITFMLVGFITFASFAFLAHQLRRLIQKPAFWKATKWIKVIVLLFMASLLLWV